MTSGPEKYGRFYWCVKVTTDIAPDGEIYVMADEAKVTECGALLFLQENDNSTNLALAPGKWLAYFAASFLDGHAVAVERWTGEIDS